MFQNTAIETVCYQTKMLLAARTILEFDENNKQIVRNNSMYSEIESNRFRLFSFFIIHSTPYMQKLLT